MRRPAYVALAAACLCVAGGVAAALVLVLGDGGGSGLTKAEYIARVNTVCKAFNAKLARVQTNFTSPAATTQSIGEALPVVVERAERARAVQPPRELEARVTRMFHLSDEAIAELRAARSAAQAGKVTESGLALGRFLEVSDEAHQIGLALGLRC